MRGSRVQAVVGELQGEKIDIIPWSQDPATFVVNALQPAEVAKVVLDEEAERIEVVVPGRTAVAGHRPPRPERPPGLAADRLGYRHPDRAEESERRQKEFNERTELFMDALDVDEMVGQLLASEGFRSVEELAYVDLSEIASIEGFDEDTAAEIQTRAQRISRKARSRDGREAQGARRFRRPARASTASLPMMVALGENDIKTIEDFRRLRHRRSRRLDRTQERRDHGCPGPPRGWLDHRGRPR
jgi:N utilization substance protein A